MAKYPFLSDEWFTAVRQIQAEALDKMRARLRVRGLSRDALL